jgi:hypothetical protein
VKLSIENGRLRIELSMFEKILSVRGSLEVPLEDIEMVTTVEPKGTWAEIRAPGTFIPWVIKAGTYFTKRGREFWYLTRWHRNFLTIHLKKGFYKRVILGFDNSGYWVETMSALMPNKREELADG